MSFSSYKKQTKNIYIFFPKVLDLSREKILSRPGATAAAADLQPMRSARGGDKVQEQHKVCPSMGTHHSLGADLLLQFTCTIVIPHHSYWNPMYLFQFQLFLSLTSPPREVTRLSLPCSWERCPPEVPIPAVSPPWLLINLHVMK